MLKKCCIANRVKLSRASVGMGSPEVQVSISGTTKCMLQKEYLKLMQFLTIMDNDFKSIVSGDRSLYVFSKGWFWSKKFHYIFP